MRRSAPAAAAVALLLSGPVGLLAVETGKAEKAKDVGYLDVEESAGLGRGWGCCNCADCFSGTGGCRQKDLGCCMPSGPFCCNADIYPARHRDFCRESFNLAKSVGKQIRCDICEKVSKRIHKLMTPVGDKPAFSEAEWIEQLRDICEGSRGSRADPEKWKDLPLEQARRAGAKDAAMNQGEGSLEKVLMKEGWEVKGDGDGNWKLAISKEYGKYGCKTQGEKDSRNCGNCETEKACGGGGCQWIPALRGGRCDMMPGRGKPIYSNFTQRDSITESCTSVLVDFGSELAEWLYIQGKRKRPTEAGDVANKLCKELSGACKRDKRRRGRRGERKEL